MRFVLRLHNDVRLGEDYMTNGLDATPYICASFDVPEGYHGDDKPLPRGLSFC